MTRSEEGFIGSYVTVFMASCAVTRYPNNGDPKGSGLGTQPVEDAKVCAEKAWASLEKSQTQSTNVTAGNVAPATTGTASTPTTSPTQEKVEPTPSTIS